MSLHEMIARNRRAATVARVCVALVVVACCVAGAVIR
jgi:hypothetical protein